MILEIKSLSKNFQQGDANIKVLDNLNLSVEKGDTLAVLGPSGSGKTTFLSLVAGLDSPTSGSILIDGQDINKMTERELTKFRSQKIGIIFQQFNLMSHLTALENIALPLELRNDMEAPSKALAALKSVGLEHRANHFPHQLSGGEQQRVAIARAFVVNPSLLLADEPSGNLDNKTGTQVMNLLFELVNKNNMTMILITHNDELAKRCKKSLILGN